MCIAVVVTVSILASIIVGVILVKRDNKMAFHRLREAVKSWDVYEIRRSEKLFGSFWDSDRPIYVVRAASPKHAMERYFRNYRKRYNEYHDYDNKILRETTYGWGVFQVKNTRSEWKTYYK